MDLTRNIQRKKEKELAALQFVGGEATTAETARAGQEKGRPQRSLPLRQRKEVQEMLRSLIGAALFAVLAHAAILPEQIGTYKRTPPQTVSLPDRPLYAEFGLDSTEQADYVFGHRKFSATVWRFRDSTGALAMFDSRRPEGATTSGFDQSRYPHLRRDPVHRRELCVSSDWRRPARPGFEVHAGPSSQARPIPAAGADDIPASRRLGSRIRNVTFWGRFRSPGYSPGIPPAIGAFHTRK